MISSNHKNVKIKGNEVEVAEDFASIVFVLRGCFGTERLAKLFTMALFSESSSDEGEKKIMRIISQNGAIDMPYDMCCVWRQEEVIYCRAIGSDDNVTMATYSSEDKAEKAVEMLRFAYTGSIAMFQNVEPTEEVNEVFKKCNTQVIYVSIDNQPSEIKFENHQNFYYQFPQDDEIEV